MADWEVLQPSAKKTSILAMADWQGLNHDLLALILRKLTLIQDFVAFGMVCISWHKVLATNKRYLPQPQTPWLMLPEKRGEDHQRRVFSLSKQNLLTTTLYISELSDKRCIGLNYGWVLTISSGEKGEMSLVHPFSRFEIELPPQTSITEYDAYKNDPTYIFTRRAALSADPSETPSDFVVMIIHCGGKHVNGGKYVGYWRPGDREWTRVEQSAYCSRRCKNHPTYFSDVTYYQDQFYAINLGGEVWSYKVSSHEQEQPLVPTQMDQVYHSWSRKFYIVVSAGTLLVVNRVERINSADYFQVYEYDSIGMDFLKTMDIGDRAIFVGQNTSICLDDASQFPGVKSNHIYYTDERHVTYTGTKKAVGKKMGSYDIQNGQTMPFEVEGSLSLINHPFWFIPSL